MSWGKEDHAEWVGGTARLEDFYGDPGMWQVRARRGKRWLVTICGGGPENRHLGVVLVRMLNENDPKRWDFLITVEVPRVMGGAWG